MRRLALVVAALTIVALNPALADPIGANLTFVSGFGSDANINGSCNLLAPCRSFQAALGVTNAGGEIVVLDPAGYGPVTINKSVSIVNDGVGIASITDTTAGTSAITIAAGPNDVVDLRGLTLTGVNGGDGGIDVTGVGTLNIQNCTIRGFTNTGIRFAPTVSSTLTVLDTVVSNNAGTGAAILLNPNGSNLAIVAYLGRVQVIGNTGHGISATSANMTGGTMVVTVADSISTGNAQSGVLVPIAPGSTTALTVILTDTALTNNTTGITAVNGRTYLAGTAISGNGTGFSATGSGVIISFDNNRITDTTNVGSLTPIVQQ